MANEYRIIFYGEEYGAKEETCFQTANPSIKKTVLSLVEFVNLKYSTGIIVILGKNKRKTLKYLKEELEAQK